ncbi:hypothetical protein AC1031_020840 [Aphanomyces cochlioides]|nr:hypothetical protein AC1031_020840 [Aphanomyces cochlioides]
MTKFVMFIQLGKFIVLFCPLLLLESRAQCGLDGVWPICLAKRFPTTALAPSLLHQLTQQPPRFGHTVYITFSNFWTVQQHWLNDASHLEPPISGPQNYTGKRALVPAYPL